jgi:hypothetical protein
MCFTPESDHLLYGSEMTLCAISDQSAAQQIQVYSVGDRLPGAGREPQSLTVFP